MKKRMVERVKVIGKFSLPRRYGHVGTLSPADHGDGFLYVRFDDGEVAGFRSYELRRNVRKFTVGEDSA